MHGLIHPNYQLTGEPDKPDARAARASGPVVGRRTTLLSHPAPNGGNEQS
jgi:hypothetical protein